VWYSVRDTIVELEALGGMQFIEYPAWDNPPLNDMRQEMEELH